MAQEGNKITLETIFISCPHIGEKILKPYNLDLADIIALKRTCKLFYKFIDDNNNEVVHLALQANLIRHKRQQSIQFFVLFGDFFVRKPKWRENGKLELFNQMDSYLQRNQWILKRYEAKK